MRKKTLYLVIFILIIALFISFFNSNVHAFSKEDLYFSYCDRPITYKLGTIDSQFNQTTQELKQNIETAASLWNEEYGKDIFVYDENAPLSINLVYDGRQLFSNKISNLENQLTNRKKSLDPEIAKLDADTESFKQKLQDLNNEIESWNDQGGAPPDEFQKLQARQNELQQEAENLRSQAQEINSRTNDYNDQVNELNNTVGNFNQVLTQKPEEGIYNPQSNRIDIYFNISKGEQIHTIAHELGHSLGIDHVNDPKAIMYSFSTPSLMLTEADKKELERVCQEVPIWQPILTRLKTTINFYRQLWQQII